MKAIPQQSQGLKEVNIYLLKAFAAKRLPESSLLREVLLTEKDQLDPVEFLARLNVWLKILERETSRSIFANL
jgi:hypothetical protein